MAAAYDAVVIGAGVNGLTLALCLQRAGLTTVVLERATQVGGMARTEEPFGAGFRHNPHATYLAYGEVSPVERDFDLEGAGLLTVTPEAQHGMAFADGRPPLVLHRKDLADRSAASLAAYSQRDGRTYAQLKAAVDGLDSLMAAALYKPPSRERAQRQVEAAARIVGRDVANQSARGVIDTLFEADEVRAFFYQLAAETGHLVEAAGSAVGFLTFTLWLVGQWRLPVGGMQAYSEALARRAREAGAEILTNAAVERIVVRGGKAAAVMVAGQGQVIARRAVVSSAGLGQTLLDLAPRTALSAKERSSVEAFVALEGPGLATMAFALSAAPDYRSARHDPLINRCFRTVIGYEDAAGTLAHLRQINAGLLPAPAAALRVNSLWDPTQAPAGWHTAGADVLMPAPGSLDPQTWGQVAEGFPDALIETWSRYAPNVTRQTVKACLFEPPQSYDRAIRLRAGSDQYRTEIDRLYLCGASTYPGGGAHGACGFNAFAAIGEDLELPAAGRTYDAL